MSARARRRYPHPVSQSNISHALSVRFFFLLFLFMIYEAGRLFWPFIGAIGGAAVLAVFFHPWNKALERRWPRLGASGRALLLDLCVLFVFLIPLGLLAWVAAREAETVYPVLN